MAVISKLKHAWNAFTSPEPDVAGSGSVTFGRRPGSPIFSLANEKSIVASTIMRIGIDASMIGVYHARLDDNGFFQETIDSGLNSCLTVEANVDQPGDALIRDIVMTMCEKGVAAVVPVDTSISPAESGGYDIRSLRVGEIVAWFPLHIKVRLYNEKTGLLEDIKLPKNFVAVIENPLYAVMNSPNSTIQRLIRKINTLDAIDDQSSSGKLDIIVQLPYAVKSESRLQQANQRRVMLEQQLKDSKYGIGWMDATEKITQLNRPAENNLLEQVKYLTEMLYGQLGITEEVMKGTADEATMINYYNRTLKPILRAITQEMRRKFLTKTARSQGQSVVFIRDPFELVPAEKLADIADKFTRNEILSSNEFRAIIGRRPSKDPKADKLINKNIPEPVTPAKPSLSIGEVPAQVVPPKPPLAITGPPGSRVKQIMEGQ